MGWITRQANFTFLGKAAAVLLLVVAADILFFTQRLPAPLGLFAMLWALLFAVTVPALRGSRAAIIAITAALFYGFILFDDPNPVAALLFLAAIGLAALLPRVKSFGNTLAWFPRLALHGVSSPFAPIADFLRLQRAGRRRRRFRRTSAIALLAIPIGGSILFLSLFSAANPMIAQALQFIQLPDFGFDLFLRMLLWAGIIVLTWSTFRPRAFVARVFSAMAQPEVPLPNMPTATLKLSLIAFNAVFAIQNLLDIVFLWSGARLPEGMTLAQYAHRGAYPLILTALLAALFVLIAFRQGSETAERPLVRRLVMLWIAQNLLLVASSILRTLDYIDVFTLTQLRIAALAWMLLVAIGLGLIWWRIVQNKSSRWLINANAASAALMLSLLCAVDTGAVAAGWNVTHAREVGGRGAPLDLCYLRKLGSSAMVPLAELEARTSDPELQERVSFVRRVNMEDLQNSQLHNADWSWRGARRLAEAKRIIAPLKRPRPTGENRGCDGRIKPLRIEVAPAAPLPPFPPKLTGEPRR
jgi:hypothetical protein